MKKWISLILTLTLLCGALSFVGTAAAEETAITLSAETLTVAVGKTVTLKAGATPYAALKKGVTLVSSDESIATVTSKGKVTGIALGTCELKVTSVYDPTVTRTVAVQVIQPVEKVAVQADTDTVFIGGTLALNVSYTPAEATLQTATFTSSKESIATVSPEGVVTGVALGKATITVKSADGYAKATYTVYVEQAPESVDVTPESAQAAAGRTVQLKATVLPSDTSNKTVLWTSADENVATVSAKGLVTFNSVGDTQIIATCQADTAVSAAVPVRGLELAQGIAFDSTTYTVIINQTTQLYASVTPESTTDKSVTYKVKNSKIATVDENGLVTGLKGGKTVVYAYTADGSKKRAATTIEVIVPVTGVSYKYKDVRVGTGSRGSFTATIKPSDATDKSMTWVSSDESIATVTGTTNRFSVRGRRWGRCKITGTTEDGGFTVDIYVDVGTLKHAVTVTSVTIKNGKPYLRLRNASDMNITQVRFEMLGYDESLQPIAMSTVGDTSVLEGAYNYPLAPGESTTHGEFTYYHKSSFSDLTVLQFCITGWSTDTGYYDHNGQLQYNYNIGSDKWEWVTYPSSSDVDALAK